MPYYGSLWYTHLAVLLPGGLPHGLGEEVGAVGWLAGLRVLWGAVTEMLHKTFRTVPPSTTVPRKLISFGFSCVFAFFFKLVF